MEQYWGKTYKKKNNEWYAQCHTYAHIYRNFWLMFKENTQSYSMRINIDADLKKKQQEHHKNMSTIRSINHISLLYEYYTFWTVEFWRFFCLIHSLIRPLFFAAAKTPYCDRAFVRLYSNQFRDAYLSHFNSIICVLFKLVK